MSLKRGTDCKTCQGQLPHVVGAAGQLPSEFPKPVLDLHPSVWNMLFMVFTNEFSQPLRSSPSRKLCGREMRSHLCDGFLLENYKIEQSHILFRGLFLRSKPSVAQWVCRASTVHTVCTPVSMPTHIWGTMIRRVFNFFMVRLTGVGWGWGALWL